MSPQSHTSPFVCYTKVKLRKWTRKLFDMNMWYGGEYIYIYIYIYVADVVRIQMWLQCLWTSNRLKVESLEYLYFLHSNLFLNLVLINSFTKSVVIFGYLLCNVFGCRMGWKTEGFDHCACVRVITVLANLCQKFPMYLQISMYTIVSIELFLFLFW